jgi:signal recognition particle subunit SRP54
MVKIVMDELADLMGGQSVGINTKGSPAVVLVAGVVLVAVTPVTPATSPTRPMKRSATHLRRSCSTARKKA